MPEAWFLVSDLFDKAAIVQLLADLRQKDRKRQIFGALAHNYTLNPPVSTSVIEEFESRYRITLPDDYRFFVTQIGNGGAGPHYGLFPLGQYDDGPWEKGYLVGDVSQPFPHIEAWNLPVRFWQQEPQISPDLPADEEQRLWDAWDSVEQEHYWNPAIMNGAIPISHIGCALRQWLVVNGKQKGFVWNDYRVDRGGVFPVVDEAGRQTTFSGWYISWLQRSHREASMGRRLLHTLRGFFK